MLSFSDFIKQIRTVNNVSQEALAQSLEVSPVLISMLESGQREPSKNLLKIMAAKMRVHPASITPFIFDLPHPATEDLAGLEKQMVRLGEKYQTEIINKTSRRLFE